MAITLKAARINKGLKQFEAAESLGVSPLTLSKWEKGETFPTVPQVENILNLYGLEFRDINFLCR